MNFTHFRYDKFIKDLNNFLEDFFTSLHNFHEYGLNVYKIDSETFSNITGDGMYIDI